MQYYPATNQFPPPPAGGSPYAGQNPYNAPPQVQGPPPVSPYDTGYQPAPYNPAEYPPQAGPTMPAPEHYYRQPHDPGVASPSQEYYRNAGTPGPSPDGRGGYPHNPENVSAAKDFAPVTSEPEPEPSHTVDGGFMTGIPGGKPSFEHLTNVYLFYHRWYNCTATATAKHTNTITINTTTHSADDRPSSADAQPGAPVGGEHTQVGALRST